MDAPNVSGCLWIRSSIESGSDLPRIWIWFFGGGFGFGIFRQARIPDSWREFRIVSTRWEHWFSRNFVDLFLNFPIFPKISLKFWVKTWKFRRKIWKPRKFSASRPFQLPANYPKTPEWIWIWTRNGFEFGFSTATIRNHYLDLEKSVGSWL